MLCELYVEAGPCVRKEVVGREVQKKRVKVFRQDLWVEMQISLKVKYTEI